MPYPKHLPSGPVEHPLWLRLSAATAPITIDELHRATRAHPNAIQHRLDRWTRAGFITRIDGRPLRFAMNDDAPRTPRPPRVARDGSFALREATARDRLWRAIRVLRSFDLPTLMIAAETSRRSAEDMINCLHRAAYLRQTERGNSRSGTWSGYRLIRNTGPRTPSISHRQADGGIRRELIDGNTGQRIDISPGAVSLRRRAEADADGGVG